MWDNKKTLQQSQTKKKPGASLCKSIHRNRIGNQGQSRQWHKVDWW